MRTRESRSPARRRLGGAPEQLRQRGLEARFRRVRLEHVPITQAGRQAFQLHRIPLGLLLLVVCDPLRFDAGDTLGMIGLVGGGTLGLFLPDLGEALVCPARIDGATQSICRGDKTSSRETLISGECDAGRWS